MALPTKNQMTMLEWLDKHGGLAPKKEMMAHLQTPQLNKEGKAVLGKNGRPKLVPESMQSLVTNKWVEVFEDQDGCKWVQIKRPGYMALEGIDYELEKMSLNPMKIEPVETYQYINHASFRKGNASTIIDRQVAAAFEEPEVMSVVVEVKKLALRDLDNV